MSEVMLHGVLNMPADLWDTTLPFDSMQRQSRYFEASKLIYSQADKIAELEEEQVEDYLEASTYTISLFNAHYKNKADAVPIELCDTTRGVVTQIDNMVTGVIAELEKEKSELKSLLEKNLSTFINKKEEGVLLGIPMFEAYQLEQQVKGVKDFVFSIEGFGEGYIQALKEGK
jgi:hypothetical protein